MPPVQLVYGEQQIQDKILEVVAGLTRNQRAKWEVKCESGNTFVAFDPAVGQSAGLYQGQLVTLDVKVEQKGQYTNYYLNGIIPPGGVASPQQQVGAPVQGAPVQGAPVQAAPVAGAPAPSSNEETFRIVRSAAMKGAINLIVAGVKEPSELLKVSDAIALYQLTGKGSALVALGLAAPPSAGEVVAQVNAELGADVVQQGVTATPEQAQAAQSQGDEIPWG